MAVHEIRIDRNKALAEEASDRDILSYNPASACGQSVGGAVTRPPRGCYQAPVTTSLPPARPASITWCASAISSKANTRAGFAW